MIPNYDGLDTLRARGLRLTRHQNEHARTVLSVETKQSLLGDLA